MSAQSEIREGTIINILSTRVLSQFWPARHENSSYCEFYPSSNEIEQQYKFQYRFESEEDENNLLSRVSTSPQNYPNSTTVIRLSSTFKSPSLLSPSVNAIGLHTSPLSLPSFPSLSPFSHPFLHDSWPFGIQPRGRERERERGRQTLSIDLIDLELLSPLIRAYHMGSRLLTVIPLDPLQVCRGIISVRW